MGPDRGEVQSRREREDALRGGSKMLRFDGVFVFWAKKGVFLVEWAVIQ